MEYKMTPIRRKEIKRVKAMLKRLEAKGYDINIDLTKIHTNKLKNMNRVNVIPKYAKYNERKGKTIEAIKKTKRKQKKAEKPKTKQPKNVTRINGNVYRGTTSDMTLNTIYKTLDEGKNYTGGKSRKTTSGFLSVQTSARRLSIIITSAEKKIGAEEIIKRVNQKFGSVEKFKERLEKLILAIYDDEYASWANGSEKYERDIREIAELIEGTDLGF